MNREYIDMKISANVIGVFKENGFYNILLIFILSLHAFGMQAQETNGQGSVKYQWKNVQIVGGGFITGIVFHPNEKGVCYSRTDMGGAYRRNPDTQRWEPLLDWLSYDDANLMGVESIALDPSDPDRLYLACGTYTSPDAPYGAVLISDDRGNSFKRTNVPFKMGANENGRGNGERMAVDPNNGAIIYLGTRKDGLWRSIDYGENWNQVLSFPDISETIPDSIRDFGNIPDCEFENMGSGILFVIFDPESGSPGSASSILYIGVSLMNRDNFFRSADGGETWEPVPGHPNKYRPTHAVLARDGNIYISYGNSPGPSRMTDGAVWKFNTDKGCWTDITPDKPSPDRAFGYAAVSVSAQDPQLLIASSYHRYDIEKGEEIFRSSDGGESWKKVFAGGGIFDNSLAPYTAHTSIHWLFDIEIDPFDPDHALFTTGYGGHETNNLSDIDRGKPTVWKVMCSGIEETVALDLLSPPQGVHLFSAIGDYGGFVHDNLDKPSPAGNFDNPRFGNTNDIDCAAQNPDIIVRVGRPTRSNPYKSIGYSLDGGKSWRPTDTIPFPDCKLGHIAVSSDGLVWVWSPDPVREGRGTNTGIKESPLYYTTNSGGAWEQCKVIPPNTRVIADPVNQDKLYGMDLFGGKFYASSDKGKSFVESELILPDGLPLQAKTRGDSRGGQDRLYAAPNKEGDLWLAAFDGLYRAKDSLLTFSSLGKVQEIHGFGFGAGRSEGDYSALYLVGVVDGVRGIFRSDDEAKTWLRINDDDHQWGMLFHVTGDPKKYGRVYVGTHGRGIFYGDPE